MKKVILMVMGYYDSFYCFILFMDKQAPMFNVELKYCHPRCSFCLYRT